MVRIIWSPQAADELEEICIYIGRDSPYYAKIFAQKIFESIEILEYLPESGRKVPELDDDYTRELLYKSYRIIYRYKKEEEIIEISSIFHGSRIFRGLK